MSHRALGSQFVFHGTTNRGAERMMQGLRNSGQTDPFGLGEGVHVTNSPESAAYFGEEKAVYGMRAGTIEQQSATIREDMGSKRGKRIGTTVVMRPKEGVQPKARRPLNFTQNIGNPEAEEQLYDASELDVVGTQPIYRTSVARAKETSRRPEDMDSPWQRLQRRRSQAMIPRTPEQMKSEYRRRTTPLSDPPIFN